MQEPSAMDQKVAQSAVNKAFQMEKALDSQLDAMENISGGDLVQIRKIRIAEMKKKQEMMQTWKVLGHGQYQEITDEKQWFEESKNNTRMVCHFYRKTTWRCDIIDKHLAKIAPRHMETRFIKIDAEKCPFLAERLSIVVMPTVIMTKGNVSHDRIEGFDELGGRDDFTTTAVERRLAKRGIIDYDGDLEASAKGQANSKSIFSTKSNPKGKSIYGTTRKVFDSDSEDEHED